MQKSSPREDHSTSPLEPKQTQEASNQVFTKNNKGDLKSSFEHTEEPSKDEPEIISSNSLHEKSCKSSGQSERQWKETDEDEVQSVKKDPEFKLELIPSRDPSERCIAI